MLHIPRNSPSLLHHKHTATTPAISVPPVHSTIPYKTKTRAEMHELMTNILKTCRDKLCFGNYYNYEATHATTYCSNQCSNQLQTSPCRSSGRCRRVAQRTHASVTTQLVRAVP